MLFGGNLLKKGVYTMTSSPTTGILSASAFSSSPNIHVEARPTPICQIYWRTSLEIKRIVYKSAGTPKLGRIESVTVLALPKDITVGVWHLNSIIIVQLRSIPKGWLATIWLDDIAEYGTGVTEADAVSDLVDSLGESLESLERRKHKLGDSAQEELAKLYSIIDRTPLEIVAQ
jgi:hypothetical protein